MFITHLGTKTGLYMEVVLMSLMTEAFHADIMSSTISMAGRDRIDLPAEADDWIRPSHASREQRGFVVTKNSTRPWGQIAPSQGWWGCGAKSFSTVPPRVSATVAPHDISIWLPIEKFPRFLEVLRLSFLFAISMKSYKSLLCLVKSSRRDLGLNPTYESEH